VRKQRSRARQPVRRHVARADPARRREVVRSLFADSRGLDILVLREDGRIRSLYQFLEQIQRRSLERRRAPPQLERPPHSASPAKRGLTAVYLALGRVEGFPLAAAPPVSRSMEAGGRSTEVASSPGGSFLASEGSYRLRGSHHGSSRGGGSLEVAVPQDPHRLSIQD